MSILYSRNGKEIKPAKSLKPTVNKNVHTLEITDTKSTDSGPYKCVAKNPKGATEHTANVSVQSKRQTILLFFIF